LAVGVGTTAVVVAAAGAADHGTTVGVEAAEEAGAAELGGDVAVVVGEEAGAPTVDPCA
jgi:hypothetical protein